MAGQTATTTPAKPNSYISNPFELIRPSFEALKVNFGTLLAVIFAPLGALLSGALLYALIALSGLTGGATNVVLFIISMLALLFVIFMLVPAITIVMLHSARGTKVTFREAVRQGRPFVLRAFLLILLTVLAVVGGLILFVIPGLIVMAWFSLATFAMVDENLGTIEAMKRSKQLVTGRVVEMWGVIGLGQAFSLLSIIPVLGFIAGIVLSVVYAPSSAIRYEQLKHGAGEVNTHWLNYVAIALAMVSVGVSTSQSMEEAKNRDTNTTPAYNLFQ